jgi:hypothetical protein
MNLDYSPILDESGKPAGVMAIVVETTERIRADGRSTDCSRATSTASSWPITSKAKSVTIYSVPPAAWASIGA